MKERLILLGAKYLTIDWTKAVKIQRIGERRISLISVTLLWGQSKLTSNKYRNLREESRKHILPSYYLIEIGAFSCVTYAEFHLKAFLRHNTMLRVERSACPRYAKGRIWKDLAPFFSWPRHISTTQIKYMFFFSRFFLEVKYVHQNK